MATIDETWALAVQYHQAGYLLAAQQACQQVLAMNPNEANAWHLLGSIHLQLGRSQAAVDCLHQTLAIYPDWAEAHHHLGMVLSAQRKFDEAAASLRRACELKPDFAEAYDELGLALQKLGRADEAVACHRRALEVNPDYAVAHNDLGVALELQGKPEEAAACYRRALQLRPDYAAALNNLGNIYKNLAKLEEAIACFRGALETLPDSPFVQCGLGTVLGTSGRLDEADACLRRALELKPDFVLAYSTLLCMMQYRDSITLKQVAEAHAEFGRMYADPLRTAWRRHDNVRDPERRLRVGFFSCDLRRHPVGFFLIRVLENLDPQRCETFLYGDGTIQDDMTDRIRTAAAGWSNIRGWTDDRLVDQIRSDRIDVLFDLAGHTSGNRLLMFARKPAPIQITWIGYSGTTGLAAMDYILADRYVIPPHSEPYYCERVLRMPDGYLCYEPPDEAPPVSPLPALEKGYPTFAAFHNPPKITSRVVEVWARILERLPAARLLLKFQGMDDPAVADRLGGQFAACGIDPARLEFRGFSAPAERFADYHQVDVALDPFPYNGCTTTCEALWMGVPVVTFPRETFAGRYSLSHLSNIGLTEMIASTLDEYVEIAATLAGDLPRLAALRAGLRERVAASPLCDGKRFAANFADIIRGVWRRWCETGQ